jgi:hypothetical protein
MQIALGGHIHLALDLAYCRNNFVSTGWSMGFSWWFHIDRHSGIQSDRVFHYVFCPCVSISSLEIDVSSKMVAFVS